MNEARSSGHAKPGAASPSLSKKRPPVAPQTPSRASSPAPSREGEVYIRADGKKVRRVRKSSLSGSVHSYNSETTASDNESLISRGSRGTLGSLTTDGGEGEVYIRADGKKVRRVKRHKKKAPRSTASSPTPSPAPKTPVPRAPTPPTVPLSTSSPTTSTIHTPSHKKDIKVSPQTIKKSQQTAPDEGTPFSVSAPDTPQRSVPTAMTTPKMAKLPPSNQEDDNEKEVKTPKRPISVLQVSDSVLTPSPLHQPSARATPAEPSNKYQNYDDDEPEPDVELDDSSSDDDDDDAAKLPEQRHTPMATGEEDSAVMTTASSTAPSVNRWGVMMMQQGDEKIPADNDIENNQKKQDDQPRSLKTDSAVPEPTVSDDDARVKDEEKKYTEINEEKSMSANKEGKVLAASFKAVDALGVVKSKDDDESDLNPWVADPSFDEDIIDEDFNSNKTLDQIKLEKMIRNSKTTTNQTTSIMNAINPFDAVSTDTPEPQQQQQQQQQKQQKREAQRQLPPRPTPSDAESTMSHSRSSTQDRSTNRIGLSSPMREIPDDPVVAVASSAMEALGGSGNENADVEKEARETQNDDDSHLPETRTALIFADDEGARDGSLGRMTSQDTANDADERKPGMPASIDIPFDSSKSGAISNPTNTNTPSASRTPRAFEQQRQQHHQLNEPQHVHQQRHADFSRFMTRVTSNDDTNDSTQVNLHHYPPTPSSPAKSAGTRTTALTEPASPVQQQQPPVNRMESESYNDPSFDESFDGPKASLWPSVSEDETATEAPPPRRSTRSNRRNHKGKRGSSEGDENYLSGMSPLTSAASVAAAAAARMLPESLMRSRADVDAYTATDGNAYLPDHGSGHMARIHEDDDAFILNTTMARKRVRVVQLLTVGLLGFLFGFLGSFFVQSSCHFGSANVPVGSNEESFTLHYGMWKYSPIDSAFQGYPYCAKYDDEYTADAPIVPRITGLVALFLGTYSLTVLWVYLIFGRASFMTWNWGIFCCVLAGIGQALTTILFFKGPVCERNSCTMGPAGNMSIFSSLIWFFLAFELYYNMPMSSLVPDIDPGRHAGGGGNLIANLEMADFEDGARQFVRRMSDKRDTQPLPTLNQIQRRKESNRGEGMMELSSAKSPMVPGGYKAPTLV